MKKFHSDFYRMTEHKWSINPKNMVKMLLHHNLRYMYFWRKYEKSHSVFVRFILYRYTKKYGLEISTQAAIGEGLYLGHPYNITVANGVKIGKNVNLHKGCTIGGENRGKRIGVPRIGDRVFIGINATVVGNITIGDDVLIAPNSYVNFDVPSHSIVIGNPAKIYKKENATDSYVCHII